MSEPLEVAMRSWPCGLPWRFCWVTRDGFAIPFFPHSRFDRLTFWAQVALRTLFLTSLPYFPSPLVSCLRWYIASCPYLRFLDGCVKPCSVLRVWLFTSGDIPFQFVVTPYGLFKYVVNLPLSLTPSFRCVQPCGHVFACWCSVLSSVDSVELRACQ